MPINTHPHTITTIPTTMLIIMETLGPKFDTKYKVMDDNFRDNNQMMYTNILNIAESFTDRPFFTNILILVTMFTTILNF